MTTQDTSSFFTTHQTRDVPRDQWGRYELPDPETGEKVDGWTRATTFAATLAESYGLRIWKERQVVWGLSRRPDLITLAGTITGPEDKKALGSIVDEAHIAAGTDAKANRGTAIHRACQAAERGAFGEVPEELRPHVAGYFKAMQDAGLQIIPEYVERVVIVPRYHVAGQLDNLVMCPDGKLRVCDKKTGNLDYADIEFAVQLAVYANAKAMFNYDTSRYEPMPEVATDYAIIAHIDPVTGKTEMMRVNIGWGWAWARVCAEVMDIRKTKHVITPYVPPTSVLDDVAAQWVTSAQSAPPVMSSPAPEDKPLGAMVKNGTANLLAAHAEAQQSTAPASILAAAGAPVGTVPGGFVVSTSPVPPEYQAFWTDDRHDTDSWDESPAEQINGVPLEQYGRPTVHPCARNESCEFTGADGLHVDGTVCLYGNERPGPVAQVLPPPLLPSEMIPVGPEHVTSPDTHDSGEPTVEAQDAMHAASQSNVDDLIAKIDGLRGGKAAAQTVARRLMARLGIEAGAPNAIKLSQYKIKIAKAIVTLAASHNASIPGLTDADPDFGTPTGPAPADPVSGTTATKAPAARGGAEVPAEDPARAEKIKTAVESIRMQGSISGLEERHAYYSQSSIGWTDEMQNAARTRAAELDNASGESPLSPMEMIQGATSLETLTKAWEKATSAGTNMLGWTPELNTAALEKQAQLTAVAMSGSQQ